MIEIKNINAGYKNKDVLKNISLVCNKGEVTTIIGANGCGKSTLLKSIIGMIPTTSGEILIDNTNINTLSETDRAKKIAYLSQGKNIPDILAGRLVLHGRFPYLSYPRKYTKLDYDIANKAMEKLGILEYRDMHMSNLSGGMRQKVYIAMALCQQADIILLDEPTTYLDVKQQINLSNTMTELASSGKTILTVLHDIILALKISNKIIVMKSGQIIKTGSPEQILNSNCIKEVFDININTIKTNNGTEYYYSV